MHEKDKYFYDIAVNMKSDLKVKKIYPYSSNVLDEMITD